MYVFFLTLSGIAIFGGGFMNMTIFGIPITYITIGCVGVSYINYFILKKKPLIGNESHVFLWLFEAYAIIMVIFSFLGLNKLYISQNLFFSSSYIFRQSYYLFMLPAIILLNDEQYTRKIRLIIKKYGNILFYIIYLSHIIVEGKISIGVPTEMLLAWLTFYTNKPKLTKSFLIKSIFLLTTPISVGGELTNLLIRLIYFTLFIIFTYYKQHVIKICSIIIKLFGIIVVGIYILPLFDQFFTTVFDANSFWRLSYWKDELTELAKTLFFGVGYGTSYASLSFVGKISSVVGGPFGADYQYTTIDKMFIVGPHNSFISIAFRLGWIGVICFVMYIFKNYKHLLKNENTTPCSYYAFFSCLIIIAVNVGLESPFYLMLFILGMGVYNDIKENDNLGGKKKCLVSAERH